MKPNPSGSAKAQVVDVPEEVAPPETRGRAGDVVGLVAEALRDRDPALARRLVAEGAVLLDVRRQDEFTQGHADGATLIPVDELGGRMAEVEALTAGDHDKPIVLYCGSGKRAAKAKDLLLSAGFRRVVNVGGLNDYLRGPERAA